MPPVSIHQAIHGYRDGHRLLSSSVSLGADAARAMLVLSDMSGPANRREYFPFVSKTCTHIVLLSGTKSSPFGPRAKAEGL